ncbi:hypothetical protein [Nannocystis pusilla]|uniref:hypothetical protein n=1 Tax=Nannocystis pusilla TaxID=889268 RepID=UPI003B7BA294
MLVTIEPGLYLVPAILGDKALCGPFEADLDRERLAAYADVRGIRIEDDVLCTEAGPDVLTAAIPATPTRSRPWSAPRGTRTEPPPRPPVRPSSPESAACARPPASAPPAGRPCSRVRPADARFVCPGA